MAQRISTSLVVLVLICLIGFTTVSMAKTQAQCYMQAALNPIEHWGGK